MTRTMCFKLEYSRQRSMGCNVFVAAWFALEYALQPLPF